MNKPLKDWTLGEIKENCNSNADCGLCRFHCSDDVCTVRQLNRRFPDEWDLCEPPRWTDDEIKFAEIFKLACKNEIFFERLKGSQILLWGEVGIDPTANAVLPYKLLPSLKEGERVTLDEIIGGTE